MKLVLRKTVLFSLIGALLISLSPTVSASSSSSSSIPEIFSKSEIEKSNQFRSMYGFQIQSYNTLSAQEYSNDSKPKLGVYLTNAEYIDFQRREMEINKALDVQRILNTDYSDSFGGMYYDHLAENGTLKIGLVKAAKSNINLNSISSKLTPDTNIEYYYVNYSYKELESKQEEINRYINDHQLGSSQVKYTDIDLDKNKITITATDALEKEHLDYFSSNYKDYIVFLPNEKVDTNTDMALPASASSYTRPLKGGLEIGGCTSGFMAYNGFYNQVFMITAGHCRKPTDNQTFYQGGSSFGTTVINGLYDVSPTNYVDALAIQISQSDLSYSIYGTNSSVYGAQTPEEEIVGQTVCRAGYVSGLGCGILRTKAIGYALEDPSGKFLTGGRRISIGAIGGDSGGTVFIQDTGIGRALIAGVNSATGNVGGEASTFYQHVSKIMSVLNIQKVYGYDVSPY